MSPFPGAIYSAVLFDLDGTLVDTAPDMVAVLQSLQEAHGLEPVGYHEGRSYVSNGAVGLLRFGFPDRDDDAIETLRLAYLERYADQLCVHSAVFAGLDTLLDRLDSDGLPWGVVTKQTTISHGPATHGSWTESAYRPAASVATPCRSESPTLPPCTMPANLRQSMLSGPSTWVILLATSMPGRAAGMGTIAAAYGYIAPGDSSASWGADVIANDTQELAQNRAQSG